MINAPFFNNLSGSLQTTKLQNFREPDFLLPWSPI